MAAGRQLAVRTGSATLSEQTPVRPCVSKIYGREFGLLELNNSHTLTRRRRLPVKEWVVLFATKRRRARYSVYRSSRVRR